MDTKWKKSKGTMSMAFWAAGVSILTVCAVFNPVRVLGGVAECRAVMNRDGSWEETPRFRSEVSDVLEGLIRIGAGQPVYGAGTAAESAVESTVVARAAEGGTAEIVFGTVEATESSEPAGTEAWTEEEIRQSAEAFLERFETDQNLLYELKQDGKVLYDNLNGQTIGGPDNALPDQYDFLLKFDGNRAEIYRNWTQQDVYGDGIYEDDGLHWRVPGYENYVLPKGWKTSEITLAVRALPVRYLDGGSWGGTFYRIWKDHRENRLYFDGYGVAVSVAAICLGLAWLGEKERKRLKEALGRCLGKIPGELRLIALGAVVWIQAQYWQNIWRDARTDALLCLLAVWAAWLICLDIRWGRRLYESSLTAGLLSLVQVRRSGMGIQKRMESLFGVPFLLALAVPVLFAAALLTLENRAQWAALFLALAAADALGLILTLYCGIRKQKETAEDLGILNDRIHEICEKRQPDACRLPADPDLAELVREVSSLSDGLEKAVEERMKSERMKVELVTNVSHDIKTPLTSIISYVDLLNKAEDLPEHLRDYGRILAQKSERLREIVQDVFEVSRAASGQLPLKMERLDLARMLRQTLADRKDAIESSKLKLRTYIPEEPAMVRADGQRMYRVFANLIENALKYSLEGSRIFLELKKEDGFVEVRIRNTSRDELRPGVDFAERFVRGDESRTDGGSGLGLSIAKSFTQACNGTFAIETAGDTFLVSVRLPEDRGDSDHVSEHEDEVADASGHDEQMEDLMGSEVPVPGVEEGQL